MRIAVISLSPQYRGLYLALVLIYHLLTLVISFWPFWVMRKQKPVRWWHAILATVGSFIIYQIYFWKINEILFGWNLWKGVRNYELILDPFDTIGVVVWVLAIMPFSLSSFYSAWLIYKKFNWKRLLLALICASVIFGLHIIFIIYMFFLGLSQFPWFSSSNQVEAIKNINLD